MTSSTAAEDDLHVRLRATLRHYAGDVQPEPPEWEELIQRAEPVVVSLRTGDRIDARARPGWPDWRRWARPALAAAAALAVVAAGAVLAEVDVPSSDHTEAGRQSRESQGHPAGEGGRSDQAAGPPGPAVAPSPQTAPGAIPAPGEASFDPAAASPVYPLGAIRDPGGIGAGQDAEETDVRTMALRYLRDRLAVPEASLEVGEPDTGNGTATVRWRAREGADGEVTAEGTLFLSEGSSVVWDWDVVGVTTGGVRLHEVRRDDRRLSFVVERADDQTDGDVAVSIAVDADADAVRTGYVDVPGGRPVEEGGPASGASVVDVPPGGRFTVSTEVAGRPHLNIAVGQVADGRWLSITEMALDAASAPVAPTTDPDR